MMTKYPQSPKGLSPNVPIVAAHSGFLGDFFVASTRADKKKRGEETKGGK